MGNRRYYDLKIITIGMRDLSGPITKRVVVGAYFAKRA